MTTPEDCALETALARVLGPEAEDTAPLSRAVLTRMVEIGPARGRPLAEVLTAPGPLAGLMFGAVLLAWVAGYASLPAEMEEILLLQVVTGAGY